MVPALALLAAAVAALAVTRHAPAHRPIAIALLATLAADLLRRLGDLPPHLNLALCLALPVLSAWAYARAWRAPARANVVACALWSCAALIAACVANGEAWERATGLAYLAPVVAGSIAWWRYEAPAGVTQRVALVLLAGDLVAAATGGSREWIALQATAVYAVLAIYQSWWVWRWRRLLSAGAA